MIWVLQQKQQVDAPTVLRGLAPQEVMQIYVYLALPSVHFSFHTKNLPIGRTFAHP